MDALSPDASSLGECTEAVFGPSQLDALEYRPPARSTPQTQLNRYFCYPQTINAS